MNTKPIHSIAIRERALNLLREGVTPNDVAVQCEIKVSTVHYWNQKYQIVPLKRGPTKQPKHKEVKECAPAPYAKGFRWFGTKWA